MTVSQGINFGGQGSIAAWKFGDGVEVFNSAGASGGLIVANGSLLTNLDGAALSAGSVADAAFSANVTLQGNAFNGINQLVQLDGTGKLPAIDGS